MAIFSTPKSDLPPPLTSIERAELTQCEELVSTGIKAFAQAGKALARIRDKQLYRESHNSFEAYVADRWSMTRQHAARLIDAAEVVRNLSPTGDGPVPLSEYQARKLAPLTPEQQRETWSEVVAAAPVDAKGKPVVTADAVEVAAAKRKPKSKRRKSRPKPVRIKVPGATVVVVPNAKFSGSAADALRAAIQKLAIDQPGRQAA